MARPRLLRLEPETPPRELGWLVPGENCTELGYRICQRAMKDIGILEVPNGSNRGTRIDRMTRRAGSPLGSWWCAIWVGAVYVDCGCLVPSAYAATDNWLPFLRPGGAKATPQPGDAILYGLRKKGPVMPDMDAHHIGIVVRVAEPQLGQHLMLTVEGNRSFAGTASNNGVAVDIGPMARRDVLGYFPPVPAP